VHLPQQGTGDGQLQRDDRLEVLHGYAHAAPLSDMTSRTVNLMRALSAQVSATLAAWVRRKLEGACGTYHDARGLRLFLANYPA
jgi:hypothetical protein